MTDLPTQPDLYTLLLDPTGEHPVTDAERALLTWCARYPGATPEDIGRAICSARTASTDRTAVRYHQHIARLTNQGGVTS